MNAATNTRWLERNLKWVILAGVLLCLLAVTGLVGGLLMIVSASMRSSDVYKTAMERVNAVPAAAQALGPPIESGFLVSGSIEVNPRSGHADLNIPVHGSRGEGAIGVLARKRGGIWYFDQLQLEAAGGAPIELRSPEQIATAEANP